ncbi:hypothetical protein OPV22_034107 [Ensete ventricosum]|uniref:Secreted protein n=1 Tax=Ensete ventricosum TaxID=4639 RepID=A0AAV8P3Z2_ENSVE|nr:hypothetical protein OPV22_034107 [Ensete ventricosum]
MALLNMTTAALLRVMSSSSIGWLSARSSATTADCRDGEFPQTDGDDVCVHAGDSCSWHDGLCYAFDPLHLKFAAEVITSFTACGLLHISTVSSS